MGIMSTWRNRNSGNPQRTERKGLILDSLQMVKGRTFNAALSFLNNMKLSGGEMSS